MSDDPQDRPAKDNAAEGMQVWPPVGGLDDTPVDVDTNAGHGLLDEALGAGESCELIHTGHPPGDGIPEGRELGFGPPIEKLEALPVSPHVRDDFDMWLDEARSAGRYLAVVCRAGPDVDSEGRLRLHVSQKSENFSSQDYPKVLRMLCELLEKELAKDGLSLARPSKPEGGQQ